jgi:hypothetical protein
MNRREFVGFATLAPLVASGTNLIGARADKPSILLPNSAPVCDIGHGEAPILVGAEQSGGAWCELPPGYKVMFIHHYIQGCSHCEIAQMFGCSVGNSNSQVHKARMRLRDLLQKAFGNNVRQQQKLTAGSLAMDRADVPTFQTQVSCS